MSCVVGCRRAQSTSHPVIYTRPQPDVFLRGLKVSLAVPVEGKGTASDCPSFVGNRFNVLFHGCTKWIQ